MKKPFRRRKGKAQKAKWPSVGLIAELSMHIAVAAAAVLYSDEYGWSGDQVEEFTNRLFLQFANHLIKLNLLKYEDVSKVASIWGNADLKALIGELS